MGYHHNERYKRMLWEELWRQFMKKHAKVIINTAFLLLLLFATVYFLFRDRELSDIFAAIHSADKFYLIIGLILVLVFVCSESVIIRYLMRLLNNKVPLGRCIKYSFVGFFFSSVTPSATGGQPMQVYYMQKDGLSASVSALVLLIITVAYKAVLVVLSGIMFILKKDFIAANLGNVKYILIYGVIVNIAFITFLIIVIFKESLAKRVIHYTVHFLGKIRVVKHAEAAEGRCLMIMEPYHEGAEYIKKHLGVLFNVFMITVFQRVSLFVVTYCVYRSFGLHGVSAFDIVTLQTVIALSVDMLPLPGGIGASETSFLAMFGTIFGSTFLMPGMLLSRGISYYALVAISGAVTVGAHMISMKKKR